MDNSDVKNISAIGNTIDADFNEDGTIQNPTILAEAEELKDRFKGKKSVRTIMATFWCDSNDIRHLEFERIVTVWPSVKYMLFGPIEYTEENKKPHLHLIIAFTSPKMFKTIIKTLNPEFYHLEPCRNFKSAMEYCLKSNPSDKLEYGTPLKQGLRTDLKTTLKENDFNILKIQENNPDLYVRYRSGLEKVCESHNDDKNVLDWLGLEENEDGEIQKKEYKKTVVHWFFGPTGVGKSKLIKQILSERILKGELKASEISIIDKFSASGFAIGAIKPDSKILVIDEFRGSTVKFSELLQIIDGKNIEIKGSKIYLHVDEIFISSCYNPYNVYSNLNKNDSVNQLIRRITDCKNILYDRVEDVDLNKNFVEYDEMDENEIFV